MKTGKYTKDGREMQVGDVVHFRCFACLHDLPDLSHARCTFHCCSCHKVQKHILCVEFLHDFLAC